MVSQKPLRSSPGKSEGAGLKPKALSAPRAAAHKKAAKVRAAAPLRVTVPPMEVIRPAVIERYLSPEELQMERDRIYARLTSIANVIARPSPADYVVFEVADPNVVHRKLVALGIPADVVQKYPKIQNGMRVFVRSARKNEEFIRALEQAAK